MRVDHATLHAWKPLLCNFHSILVITLPFNIVGKDAIMVQVELTIFKVEMKLLVCVKDIQHNQCGLLVES